jgi:AP-2 complex subunit mu-1
MLTKLIFEFLYKVVALGKSYFGTFNEQAVKDNFTLIYELFDEICDFGYPQTTEADTLKLYITTETIRSEKAADASKIAIQATGAVSWRRPDIKYRKNEMFVDIIESVNLIMSAKGKYKLADHLNPTELQFAYPKPKTFKCRDCSPFRCIRSDHNACLLIWNA